MKISCYCIVLLLCCQYGIGYRVYILPEPDTFCLGVFSGDDCITWEDYSANPTFADHSTTLIFTPGNRTTYYGRLSVVNIKTFIMIGDRAELEFQLSLSNIGYVRIHNLSFLETSSSSGFDVRDVPYFIMENCILSRIPDFQSWEPRLLFYYQYYSSRSNLVNIVNSTFERVLIDIRSHSSDFTTTVTLIINSTIFSKYLGTVITGSGDYYSNAVIQTSWFINNYVSLNNLVYIQGSLTVVDCLFDRNHITGTNTGVLYGTGNVIVTNSNFTDTSAGYAIVGLQNVNITGCMFSNNTQSDSVVYINSQYSRDFGNYITDSKFYNCSRAIYSQASARVIVTNSDFFDITATGRGGVIYSSNSVTLTNCTIINSTAIGGDGGAVYSEGPINVLSSHLVNNSVMDANSRGGSLYSSQSVMIANCSIINSYATAYGGAVYGREIPISDTLQKGKCQFDM